MEKLGGHFETIKTKVCVKKHQNNIKKKGYNPFGGKITVTIQYF